MGDRDIKVTDKRMFTADGELREEFRHLENEAAEPAPEPPTAAAEEPQPPTEPPPAAERPAAPPAEPVPPPVEAAPPTEPASPPAESPEPPPAGEAGRVEIPGAPGGFGAPTFVDLVTLLAEPIALYLGDMELPDGKSAENLDMARLHIDLLDVLRRKTAGNLEIGEARLLEDLLYRCRLRYVQKRD